MKAPKVTIPDALVSLPDGELAEIFGCSRQAVLFARRRRAGECVKCGKTAEPDSQYCRTHRAQARRYQRNRNRARGYRPWKPGRPGRKPLEGDKAA